MDPLVDFGSYEYRRHNSRRLEHLATLGLELAERRVLELGAGIGDHTSYFIDRGCRVTSVEGREQNVAILRSRFPDVEVILLDLEAEELPKLGTFEIVYAYGILYHLSDPVRAIRRMAAWCDDLLLLETCVAFGNDLASSPIAEPAAIPSQSIRGQGSRPTRRLVFDTLRSQFPFVYVPLTQPCHLEFPLDWSTTPLTTLARSIFIAARGRLQNDLLKEELLIQQRRAF